MKFPETIKSLREKRGLTQEEVAKLANVSQVSICKYEKGQATPYKNTLIQLAKVLGVKPNDLIRVIRDDEGGSNDTRTNQRT